MGWPTLVDVRSAGGCIAAAAALCCGGRSACGLQQLKITSWRDRWWSGSRGCVFLCRGRVHMVAGEVLPIYHTVLFVPRVVESLAPSQAHLTPKHDIVLSVLLHPASRWIPSTLFKP